jgi:hypothetical protein
VINTESLAIAGSSLLLDATTFTGILLPTSFSAGVQIRSESFVIAGVIEILCPGKELLNETLRVHGRTGDAYNREGVSFTVRGSLIRRTTVSDVTSASFLIPVTINEA